MSPTFPHRGRSRTRLLLVVVLAITLLIAAAARFGPALLGRRAAAPAPWFARGASFAPYVDVTLPPTFAFDADDDALPDNVVLSFIVADPADPCRPTWGGQYSLDAAGDTLDLDGRIERLRARGGDIIIAFGGAAGTELAAACADENALVAAYQSVIDRYAPRALDFDIEGAALADGPADLAVLREGLGVLLRTLYPAAPHITHALWVDLGFAVTQGELLDAPWPAVDEAALVQDEIELVLQVNGKLRGALRVPASASKADIEAAAVAHPECIRFAEGKPAKKVVVVPGRLVNVVV